MKLIKRTASFIIRLLFSTQLHLMMLYRTSRWLCLKFPWSGVVVTPCARHLMRIYSSCDISPKASIGKRFSMPHPIGIVIGDGVRIGNDVKLWQHTTIGSHGRRNKQLSYPLIGDRVRIYAGATLIGGITIGNDAIIGAHSLVSINVPADRTAAGCPAALLAVKERSSE